ncbi:MAG: hypothetical protein H6Q70_2945 [Firmicutes bacterium]|nr:hypothetical protein [Bacillota bacterium]
MRIENYNSFSQAHFSSDTAKRKNVQLPDYTDWNSNTQTAPSMSNKQYTNAIIEQAKKDQAAGKFQSESAGFRSLAKSYISTASPDRKNIITAGLTAIYKNNKPQPETFNLMDYLCGTAKYKKQANDVSYAEFYDSNGEMVATYSNTGWTFFGTKAENARESELWDTYNNAWNTAAKASQGQSSGATTDTTTGSINLSV